MPTSYNINGETIYVYPGRLFTKNELILRLKEMNFAFVDSDYKKEDLITLYDIATNYQNNIEKIINKLKFDYKYFRSRDLEQRRHNLDEEEDNISNNDSHNSMKRNFYGSINSDNQTRNNDNNKQQSNSYLSSFCKKIIKILYNHKMDIFEKAFFIMMILSIDYFIQYISNKYYILGKILKEIRKIVTPRRLIVLYLIYAVVRYILDTFLYYLFGFGIIGLLFLIFKGKIKDFLLSL